MVEVVGFVRVLDGEEEDKRGLRRWWYLVGVVLFKLVKEVVVFISCSGLGVIMYSVEGIELLVKLVMCI